jgi:MYXO-CTERM domain-containing protein
MRRRTLGWWLVVVVLAASTPAWAHDGASAPLVATPLPRETVSAAPSSTPGLGTLVAALALVLVAMARRRRAVAIVSIALLVLVAFEAGYHSVHHLADQPDVRCVVASAAAHTAGVIVDAAAFEPPADATIAVMAAPAASAPLRPAPPDLGRAPPIA